MNMNMPMNMGQMSAYMAPTWFIYSLSALFFCATFFYLYRLANPAKLKSAYGYYDWQNEIAHALGAAAMAFAIAPPALQILPPQFWADLLSVGAIVFLVRALTWGRRLPYNKWWWDWAHFAMFVGMVFMFLPIDVGAFSYVLEVFWLWFTFYYTYSLCHDLVTEPKPLFIGSDLSHLAKGAVMLVMTILPMALMPPGGSMPGMICSPNMSSSMSFNMSPTVSPSMKMSGVGASVDTGAEWHHAFVAMLASDRIIAIENKNTSQPETI
jgi:hypothetical protein